jgi:hypothetical protein
MTHPIGFVVLNEQIIPAADSNDPTVVNGIHVVVNVPGNALGLAVGSEIVIAHAEASAGKA